MQIFSAITSTKSVLEVDVLMTNQNQKTFIDPCRDAACIIAQLLNMQLGK